MNKHKKTSLTIIPYKQYSQYTILKFKKLLI